MEKVTNMPYIPFPEALPTQWLIDKLICVVELMTTNGLICYPSKVIHLNLNRNLMLRLPDAGLSESWHRLVWGHFWFKGIFGRCCSHYVVVFENRTKNSSILEGWEAAHSHVLSDHRCWRESGENGSILLHVKTEPMTRLPGFATAEITSTLFALIAALSLPCPKEKNFLLRVTKTKLLCPQNKYHPLLCVYKAMSQIFKWSKDASLRTHWTDYWKSVSVKHPECVLQHVCLFHNKQIFMEC